MEDKDLGSKRINNEKPVNEGFSGTNIPENYNPSTKKLNTEVEKDAEGNTKVVERARNANAKSDDTNPDKTYLENEKKVENKDFNSDVTPKRYDNSDPANRENRGNIEMDND